MRRGQLFALVSMLLACLLVLACETTSPEEEQAAKAEEDWAALQAVKTELDEKRAELAQLKDQVANFDPDAEPAAEEGDGGEEGAEGAEGETTAPPTLEELQAQVEAAQQGVYTLTDSFGGKLAQFINDQQIGVDSELTEMQAAAMGMKADEDILLAQDYIERGGEYQRAIDIYNQSLVFDPGNEKILAAKASAEELRYMSEERFAQVKKNMTEEEVRATLGTPKSNNVRTYDDTGVTAWFYPKAEPNTAAGVFFQPKKDVLKVYKTEYDAVKAPTQ